MQLKAQRKKEEFEEKAERTLAVAEDEAIAIAESKDASQQHPALPTATAPGPSALSLSLRQLQY